MAKKKEEVVEVKTKEEVKKKEADTKVVASFITKDVDGLKTKHVFVGKGKSIKDAIDVRNQEDEDIIFPRGINQLVNTKVSKGENTIEKALAPHRARAIFEDKNEEVFKAAYRGL